MDMALKARECGFAAYERLKSPMTGLKSMPSRRPSWKLRESRSPTVGARKLITSRLPVGPSSKRQPSRLGSQWLPKQRATSPATPATPSGLGWSPRRLVTLIHCRSPARRLEHDSDDQASLPWRSRSSPVGAAPEPEITRRASTTPRLRPAPSALPGEAKASGTCRPMPPSPPQRAGAARGRGEAKAEGEAKGA
jgi:hypothetical protein